MKVFLIGFMGSGKTTYGRAAAVAAGMPFLDLDEVIETEAGKKITEIFAGEGEERFRMLEHEALRRVAFLPGEAVIAVGGGTPCFFNNMSLMNDAGTTIYLKHPPHALVGNLQGQRTQRPLIAGMDDEELLAYIKEKLAEREAFYVQSKVILEWPEISAEKIDKVIKRSGDDAGEKA
jgi:shikimate kinase